jgi:hypothetical protein
MTDTNNTAPAEPFTNEDPSDLPEQLHLEVATTEDEYGVFNHFQLSTHPGLSVVLPKGTPHPDALVFLSHAFKIRGIGFPWPPEEMPGVEAKPIEAQALIITPDQAIIVP